MNNFKAFWGRQFSNTILEASQWNFQPQQRSRHGNKSMMWATSNKKHTPSIFQPITKWITDMDLQEWKYYNPHVIVNPENPKKYSQGFFVVAFHGFSYSRHISIHHLGGIQKWFPPPPRLENPPKYFPSAVRGYDICVWSARMICFPDLLGDVVEGSPPTFLDGCLTGDLLGGRCFSVYQWFRYLWELNCNKNLLGFPPQWFEKGLWWS